VSTERLGTTDLERCKNAKFAVILDTIDKIWEKKINGSLNTSVKAKREGV